MGNNIMLKNHDTAKNCPTLTNIDLGRSSDLELKNTGFKGSIARKTFYTEVEGMSWAEGVQPDHRVYLTAQDLISGKDAVLELTLNLITGNL